MISASQLRKLALALPGVEEGTSYGTPAFRVRKKLLARVSDDGESLVLRIDMTDREALMRSDPKTFFVTDHYRDHSWVLVRLATVKKGELAALFERAWRDAAPAKLIAEHGARR